MIDLAGAIAQSFFNVIVIAFIVGVCVGVSFFTLFPWLWSIVKPLIHQWTV
jgi:hypothetical protein